MLLDFIMGQLLCVSSIKVVEFIEASYCVVCKHLAFEPLLLLEVFSNDCSDWEKASDLLRLSAVRVPIIGYWS